VITVGKTAILLLWVVFSFPGNEMIKVTRLNNSEFWVNAEMIKFVEATPDTVISMATNDKIIVKEAPEAIVDAVVNYRRGIVHQRPQIIKGEK
jgi:flagellar protein FlbD